MANYRRRYAAGGTYFFTLVTHERRPLFLNPVARRILRESIQLEQAQRPFSLFAICLLPEHLHAVWTLPDRDSNYSTRWRRIKEEFTNRWLTSGGEEGARNASRQRKQERGIWQRRFWEHTVRDADDLKRCVDYTHWNPRKHNLACRIKDWPWSTFSQFVEAGEYELDWGGTDPTPGWNSPEWGE